VHCLLNKPAEFWFRGANRAWYNPGSTIFAAIENSGAVELYREFGGLS